MPVETKSSFEIDPGGGRPVGEEIEVAEHGGCRGIGRVLSDEFAQGREVLIEVASIAVFVADVVSLVEQHGRELEGPGDEIQGFVKSTQRESSMSGVESWGSASLIGVGSAQQADESAFVVAFAESCQALFEQFVPLVHQVAGTLVRQVS